MPSRGIGSRVFVFLIIGFLSGCGEGVQVIPESETSGVVRYIYREYQGYLLSPRRAQAMEEAQKFCGGSVRILREGPTRGRKHVVEGIAGGDVIEETWWGMRFHCK